ncbi:MAG: HAD family hydrolase [Burkholderiaceae bacterium]
MPASPASTDILAITIDLDDTLWPVRPTLIAAEARLARWLAENAPATATGFDPRRRSSLRARLLERHPDRAHDPSFMRRESLRLAMAEAGEDPRLAEAAFEVFLAARQMVEPYEDVEAVLCQWAERYRLVALSNGNADIARIPCGRHFSAAISAHEIGFAKPDPRIFAAACEAAGALPGHCLHVGDDWHLDIAAAHAAGMHTAWVRRPEFDDRPVPEESRMHRGPVFDSLRAVDDWLHADPPGRPAARSRS